MTETKHSNFLHRIWCSFNKEKHIAPLAVLRMAFGAVLFISTIRFLAKGWVHEFYIAPEFHFPFLNGIQPLPAAGMYLIFIIMALSSLGILAGCFYRISITVFFLCFVYVELIDKTYYLNHYYAVSIFAFLLMLVPAHSYCSVDAARKPALRRTQVPGWTINIFKWQLCLIYFYAGLSKLNQDWLIAAMPLKIWLPANRDVPLIGPLLEQEWVAYVFSWFGALFDLSIGFLLLYKPARSVAYVFVVIFHVFTGWLFKIGMFPYIMVLMTLVFFSPSFHIRICGWIYRLFGKQQPAITVPAASPGHNTNQPLLRALLGLFMLTQLLLPFRFLLYSGALFWTEQGYRFSWRVMLMEKSGTAFFYVKDPVTGRKGEVRNTQYLTPMQERMMATQPDMILQYAHYLHDIYQQKGIKDPVITADCYVTLNGSGSRPYIDTSVDLSRQSNNFLPKKWILPFHQ